MIKNDNLRLESEKEVRINQFDISFMRVRINKAKDVFLLEDERKIKNVNVGVSYQEESRIVSLIFSDCNDEDYLHIRNSVIEAKECLQLDYELKYSNYIFHLEFNTEKELSCGGDVNTTKNKCYVDDRNNSIIFME